MGIAIAGGGIFEQLLQQFPGQRLVSEVVDSASLLDEAASMLAATICRKPIEIQALLTIACLRP